jgi:hypothetical protein
MSLDLMQPNNDRSGQTQSKTENSGPERPIEGRKSVLPDPVRAKYPRKSRESQRLEKNRLQRR